MGDRRRRSCAAAYVPPLPGAVDAKTACQPDPLRRVRTELGVNPLSRLWSRGHPRMPSAAEVSIQTAVHSYPGAPLRSSVAGNRSNCRDAQVSGRFILLRIASFRRPLRASLQRRVPAAADRGREVLSPVTLVVTAAPKLDHATGLRITTTIAILIKHARVCSKVGRPASTVRVDVLPGGSCVSSCATPASRHACCTGARGSRRCRPTTGRWCAPRIPPAGACCRHSILYPCLTTLRFTSFANPDPCHQLPFCTWLSASTAQPMSMVLTILSSTSSNRAPQTTAIYHS